MGGKSHQSLHSTSISFQKICLTLETNMHKQEPGKGDHKYMLKWFVVGHRHLQGQSSPLYCSILVHNLIPGYLNGDYTSLLVHEICLGRNTVTIS